MAADIRLHHFLSEGLAYLFYNGDGSLWSKVKVRKATTCAVTGDPIAVGEEAWRPIGNQQYRMQRVGIAVMDRIYADDLAAGQGD